jgi:hypothetical protein
MAGLGVSNPINFTFPGLPVIHPYKKHEIRTRLSLVFCAKKRDIPIKAHCSGVLPMGHFAVLSGILYIPAMLSVPFLHNLTFASDVIKKSGEWERIKHNEYILENCTWNIKEAKSAWRETIFCDTIGIKYGWEWDFSGETDNAKNYIIKTFPEIIYGRKPYDGYESTTDRLPVRLDSAKFTISYEYSAEAEGIYNTSTDISFTDKRDPEPADIRAKLMIWFDHKNMDFFRSKPHRNATIEGRKHDVFIDTNHTGPEGGWIFIAMLPEEMPDSGDLHLEEYFRYLLREGVLKPEWFLSSIETGSEIASGNGRVTFGKFVVH